LITPFPSLSADVTGYSNQPIENIHGLLRHGSPLEPTAVQTIKGTNLDSVHFKETTRKYVMLILDKIN
ncbi:hypothetical protein, partial [Paraferrimonas sp. SM1919]|uniref:hypothetical protein n=1 Tax=Paraferrimonas sp. SM1919 TaxID=2662263 RepID=UPI001969CD71